MANKYSVIYANPLWNQKAGIEINSSIHCAFTNCVASQVISINSVFTNCVFNQVISDSEECRLTTMLEF